MRGLIFVFQFFTRIPLPVSLKACEEDLGAGMKLLPVVGAVIGIMMLIVYRAILPFDRLVASVTAILLETVITGGLHQDGLGDTFDGLYSNTSGQRMLDIMKDSRLGTHGVLAVTGVMFIKISMVNALNSSGALVAMPIFSRLAMVFGTAFSEKTAEKGLGRLFIDKVDWKDAVLSALLAGILALYHAGGAAMVVVAEAAALVLAYFCIGYFNRRIGCMTGDTLGALGEIYSVVFLVLYAIMGR
jgi:adenosylcobinamide-GDP ribazoletransferase